MLHLSKQQDSVLKFQSTPRAHLVGKELEREVKATRTSLQLRSWPEAALCMLIQDIDPRGLLHGSEALMKVQITYCDEAQTLLGISLAHVLAGMLRICCQPLSSSRLGHYYLLCIQ